MKQPTTILLIVIVVWLVVSQLVPLFVKNAATTLLNFVLIALMIAYLVVNFFAPHDDVQ